MKHFLQKSIFFFLAFDLVFAPLGVAAQETGKETGIAQESAPGSETISYTQLMRNTHALATGKRVFVSEKSDTTPPEGLRAQTLNDFERFLDAEKKRLDDEGIGWLKQRRYLKRLERQIQLIDGVDPSAFERIATWFKKLFGKEEVGYESNEARKEIIPQKPARFEFENQVIQVKSINLTESLPVTSRNDKHTVSLGDAARTAFTIRPVYALEDNLLPSYEDITADGGEALVTSEIQELASSLEYNPVAISNFVRNAVTYEPYWGAKKGSVGCLRELVCNDTDAASLTIALLRASGIPARYKKTVSVFSVDQLKRLLGVEEAKSAYAAFAFNHIPIFTISGNPDAGRNLDDADLSQETHFAVEWTHVEAFYDYDDRGGNTANLLDVSTVQNTAELRDLLRDYHKKQWVPIDVVVKPYAHEQANIVSDQANFDTEAFWNGYFAYQGDLAPLKKYRADLLQATGQDIDANRSVKRSVQTNHTVLPPTLPYTTGQGVAADGAVIAQESWSALPDARKQQVTITLQRAENNATVLRHTFFVSEINNALLTLTYEGATPQDQQTIEQRGGIHQTPAEIVHIIPYLATDFSRYQGINNDPDNTPIVSIGEPLVLQFEYRGAGDVKTDQKFSVAGNHEGIFMTFSGIQDNFIFDDADDPNRASKILLEGNAAIAREYLKTVFTDAQTLEKALDYEYNIEFARAVVTQNRVLSEVDGAPTTFDFKGLTIDSGAYIADYSNRGDYKNHRKDFRLLWGLIASHWEGRLFTDLTGLNATATVQGLQYAHAHPETYAVHRISQENEAAIDQLNLSDNTKANMHAAVAAGNTIITPDRPIEDGVFRGIVYVSLDPEWTGTYAIGEQVGNGGFTTDRVLVASLFDDLLQIFKNVSYVAKNGFVISYQDGQKANGVTCTIQEARHNELIARADWREGFGFPCYENTQTLGTVQHTYITTENATKFYGVKNTAQGPVELYNYWVRSDIAKDIIEDANPNYSFKTFKFNIIAGTYSSHGSLGVGSLRVYWTGYYQPVQPANPDPDGNARTGNGWLAEGAILSELEDKSYKPELLWCPPNNDECSSIAHRRGYVLYKIGYPTSNEEGALESYPFGTEGTYQSFIGGQVYHEIVIVPWWFDSTYYVPGYIAEEYNRDVYCQEDHGCGSGGILGFPLDDPVYSEEQNMILQDFESGTRIKAFLDQPAGQNIETLENVERIAILRNLTDPAYHDDFIEGIVDAFYESGVYGGVAINFAAGLSAPFVIKKMKRRLMEILGKKVAAKVTVRYIPLVGWAYAITTTGLAVEEDWPLYQACMTDPDIDPDPFDQGKSPAYYCGKLGVNGAAAILGGFASWGGSKIINRIGVGTLAARMGKSKFFAALDNKNDWSDAITNTQSSKNNRTAFFERVYELGDDDVRMLSQKSKIQKRLLSSKKISKIQTFNGFIKEGPLAGRVAYRVHPDVANERYNGILERDLYARDSAFDLEIMIQQGITKRGFYNMDELGDALRIYRNNNFSEMIDGKFRGEIIFVVKKDGTVLFSPRRNFPQPDGREQDKLPHAFMVKGEDVAMAGRVRPDPNGGDMDLLIDNDSGHYKAHADDLDIIKDKLVSGGYSVEIDQPRIK